MLNKMIKYHSILSFDDPTLVFLQYTEINDSFGTEIYDGDIIKRVTHNGKHCRYPDNVISDVIRPVKFGGYDDGEYVSNVGCWLFGDSCNSMSDLITNSSSDGYYIREYTVIGNIFENIYLLKNNEYTI